MWRLARRYALVVGQVVPTHQQLSEFIIKSENLPIRLLALASHTHPFGFPGCLEEPINERHHPGRKGVESSGVGSGDWKLPMRLGRDSRLPLGAM
jgi:hypothetical protein